MLTKKCKRCGVEMIFNKFKDEKSNKAAWSTQKYCDTCRIQTNREKNTKRVMERRKVLSELRKNELVKNSIISNGIVITQKQIEKGSNIKNYVYWFKHPEHEYLYIGKSNQVFGKRIIEHLKCSTDSIDRKYLDLLKHSKVFTCELSNKTESDMIESMLINEYKPFLNKAKKYDTKSVNITFELTWKEFDISKYTS